MPPEFLKFLLVGLGVAGGFSLAVLLTVWNEREWRYFNEE